MAGRPKRRGRLITPGMAEKLAREGKLHGPYYSEAFLSLLGSRNPASAHDPYAVHLLEARIAAQRAGEKAERENPLVWREIREIDALARRYERGDSREFYRELAELKKLQAERRAASPSASTQRTRRRRRRS